jgi:hypothetical protein
MLRLGTVKSNLVLVHSGLGPVLLGSRVVDLCLCWVSPRVALMAICCSGMDIMSLAVGICCESMMVSRIQIRDSVFILVRLVDGSDIVRTTVCAREIALRWVWIEGHIFLMGDWSDMDLMWSRTTADNNMRVDLLISP